jgi:hypothetical protein
MPYKEDGQYLSDGAAACMSSHQMFPEATLVVFGPSFCFFSCLFVPHTCSTKVGTQEMYEVGRQINEGLRLPDSG